MGIGFLETNIYLGDHLLPIENINVLIKDESGDIVYESSTDKYGKIEEIPLPAPAAPEEWAVYSIEVPTQKSYKKVIIKGVEIFDKQTTVLPIKMYPVITGYSIDENTVEIDIPNTRAACSRCSSAPGTAILPESIAANEVAIPDYITVHLGYSNDDSARNVRVPFKDYIKNVASREIFPCWSEAAITANVLAQMSFALNRIYTLFWPSRGKNFDITNKTDWDQAFDPSLVSFQEINNVVEKVFTKFIRRQGRREPFLSSYCDGVRKTCDGLYQCQSQDLGLAGYSAIEILKYFYPNDIQISQSDNFTAGIGRYPGTPLREGSSGEDVLRMQIYLNRLSGNWWIDPIPVQNVNGFFGSDTRRAVMMFQQNTPWGLAADGIIGRNTWYEITRTYIAATQLSELTSEGERIGIGQIPPTVILYPNTDPVTRGQYVVELQFLLNYIAQFYESMTPVIQNGVFREDTKRAVLYFQQEFGLTPDGIVGPQTWKALYDVFHSLQSSIIAPPAPPSPPTTPPAQTIPPFPGTSLRVGSSGANVVLIQNTLNAIGQVYTSIPALVADGAFGPLTERSVMAFQRQFGLSADGVVGPITWNKIFEVYNSLIASPSLPQFPGTNLTIGSRGNDVAMMQSYLLAISKVFPVIPSLTADGIFGTGTAASVRAFQALFGLNADGIIGRSTWDKIVYVYNSMPVIAPPVFSGNTLQLGSRGNDVIIMQKYLNLISEEYPEIPALGNADGIFGEATVSSVQAFQRHFGLTADGRIGINTWNKIVSVYNQIIMSTSGTMTYSATSLNTQNSFANRNAMLLALMGLRRF